MNSFGKINRYYKTHNLLIENFSYLAFLQIFLLAYPLITYPYLVDVLGKELYNKLNLCFPNNGKKYIIQQNISSGGEGTFVISDAKETLTCSENEVYLLSPYYEKTFRLM